MKKYRISINQEIVVKTSDVNEGINYLVDCIREFPYCDIQELPDDYENEDGSEIHEILTDEEWIEEVLNSNNAYPSLSEFVDQEYSKYLENPVECKEVVYGKCTICFEPGGNIKVKFCDNEWIPIMENNVKINDVDDVFGNIDDEDWYDDREDEMKLNDEDVYDLISELFYNCPCFPKCLITRKKDVGDEFNLFNEVVCLIYDVFNWNNPGDEPDYSDQIDTWCERHREVIMERFKRLL